ncbi:hypothetical protein [Virgibacillus siamensis]|uniref:hypothetical protein n=1 Tax=Virgibacillus siamensis TaxID=480071 RepID=UPI0011158C52|nr:hypothetical protein [Virgibacillus siamensis]
MNVVYEIPEEHINLEALKKETLPVRMAAVKSVLEMEPLSKNKWISLHPSTVFFRPMTTTKFAYMDVFHLMDQQEYTALEQYKALAYSLISCQSYEAFLRHGIDAYKKKKLFTSRQEQAQINKLMATIKETETLKGLQEDLQDSYDYTQYQYFQDIVSIKQRAKKRYRRLVMTTVVILGIGAISGYLFTDMKQEALAKKYEEKMEMKELKIDKVHAVENGNFKNVITIMEQMEQSKEAITDFLYSHEQYQLGLSYNPTIKSVKKVVSILYEKGQKEKLLDLTLEDNLRLSDEKAIVSYDKSQLASRKSFITDPKLANRMGKAFVEHGDLHSAEYLALKFEDKELKEMIEKVEKEQQEKEEIARLEKEIQSLKKDIKDADDKNKKEKLEKSLGKAKEKMANLKE